MIPKKDFLQMRKDLGAYEVRREQVILASRSMIRQSKEIIQALHRDDLKKAQAGMRAMASALKKFPKQPWESNIASTAIQEYVEAAAYYYLVTKKRLPSRAELRVHTPEYLMGLCDLTGELVRKTYKLVRDGKTGEAKCLIQFCDDLYAEFLHLNLRGDLRKKSDSIKYNLAKLEQVGYDIAIRKDLK